MVVHSCSVQKKMRKITLWVIFLGFLIDCLYQTMLAPMLPDLLYDMQHSIVSSFMDLSYESKLTTISAKIVKSTADTKINDMLQESPEIGILICLKPVTQIIMTPVIGSVSMKLGYSRILFAGFFFMTVSCLLFAFSFNYWPLLLSKSLHGFSSSCLRVSGFGMVASSYSGNERETMFGLVLGGVICGECAGLIYGGFAYVIFGKIYTFLIIGITIFVVGVLHLLTMTTDTADTQDKNPKKIIQKLNISIMVRDPVILCLSGCSFFGNIQFSMLQACLPLHMLEILNSSEWERGAVFLPQTLTYMFAVVFVPTFLQRTGRWPSLYLGLLMTAFSFLMISLSKAFIDFLLPIGLAGLATGIIDIATLAELGYISDLKYSSEYAKIYAVNEFSIWTGYAVGPLISGVMINILGFTSLMISSASLCVIYMLIMISIHSSTRKSLEKMRLLGDQSFVTQTQVF